MKIFVIACLHGTETFGLKVLESLPKKDHSVRILVAHPEAVAKKKRSIEADLNRSFGHQVAPSAEKRLAKSIMSKIDRFDPDLIIDLHTSTVNVGKVAIIAANSDELAICAKQLGMGQIVIMPPALAHRALIGQHPNKTISVELGRNYRSASLAKDLADNIVRLSKGHSKPAEHKIPLFEIKRIIKHQEAEGLTLENYTFSNGLAGYPFLTGRSNYQEHRGFLAVSQGEV